MNFDEVKTDMEFLGIYKKEFDETIRVYLDIIDQYKDAWNEYVDGGKQSLIECRGGYKKNPILMILESLRKDYITYSDRLGLNPKALDQIKNAQVTQEATALDKFLNEFKTRNDNVQPSND